MGVPAERILREYLADVVGRYHGRELTPDELDAAVRAFPPEEIARRGGVLWIARVEGRPIGCVGLLTGDEDERVGEVTRLFVTPACRRQGIAQALMAELERHARAAGLRSLRLDTRSDLTEAGALYARLGFFEVEPFSDGPYAEHWFARELT